MHGRRFDDLARAFASGTSRRLLIKGGFGAAGSGLLTALGLGRIAGQQSQGCAETGASCLRDEACCSGFCDLEARECACPDGQEDCDGECADLSSDPAHCGACGEACQPGQRCLDDACCAAAGGTCADDGECCGGLSCCDGACADIRNDPDNCGDCGNTCPYDPYLCEAPTCDGDTCGRRPVPDGTACVADDPSYACCGQACVDLYREENCGECGRACADGQTCCRGEGCFDLQTDSQHCGGCFHLCDPGETCVDGACCPGPGTVCASDEDCCGGDACCNGRCAGLRDDPNNCGGCGAVCPPGQACAGGTCGSPGQPGGGGDGGTGGTIQPRPGQGAPPSGQGAPVGGGCGGGVTCGPGAGCCGGTCVDVSGDPSHCGGCDRPCAAGQVCSGGVCTGGTGGAPGGELRPGCGDGPPCGQGRSCCGDVCVDLASDPTNCGGCGVACGAGETCCNGGCVGLNSCPPQAPLDFSTCACRCADGRPPCGSACCAADEGCLDGACAPYVAGGECEDDEGCDAPFVCCDGTCADPTNDRRNCGECGLTCAEGKECCDGRCVSLLTGSNCGACGVTCPPGACCRNGECICSGGHPPCGGRCPDYSSDPEHCGSCGRACGEDETCHLGECQPTGETCDEDDDCPEGYGCCDEVCYDHRNDPEHCGECHNVCQTDPSTCRLPACYDGQCGDAPAPDGYTCRDDDPYYRCCGGYCANTQTDPHHCGACGYACDPGYSCCHGEGCYDLQNDPHHCGSCDNACETGETCVGGTCAPFGGAGTGCAEDGDCAEGLTCCDGYCRDMRTDPGHCGECGTVCANPNPPCAGVRSSAGPAGTYPLAGRPFCTEGEEYFVCCDSACVDVLSDPRHCGDCGLTCGDGQECALGVCTGTCEEDAQCGAGQSCCGGVCVDTARDPRYCGDCDTACGEGELCCEGTCTPADPNNCGVCGYVCHHSYPICEPSDVGSTGYHCCTEPGTACDPLLQDPCCGDSACLALAPETYACCLPDGEGCEGACGAEQLCPPCCSGYCGPDGTCAPNPDLCEDGRPFCGEECCPAGTSCCGDQCVDLQTDPAYCGHCDNACPERMGCYRGQCCHFEGEACEEANAQFGCCEGLVCQEGTCAPTTGECEDGSDCPEGWGCCEGSCYDLFNDPNHCGECGVVCDPGTTCVDRVCQPTECVPTDETCPENCQAGERCDQCCGGYCGGDSVCYPCGPGGACETSDDCCEGLSCCGGTCVDNAHDPAYCGDCETTCTEATDPFQCQRAVCRLGVCDYDAAEDGSSCVSGDDTFACCEGVCTDLLNTLEHCGACGVACSEEQTCCRDGCYDLQTDPTHCGDCEVTCPAGLGCYRGECCHFEADACGDANNGFGCCEGLTCQEDVCVPTDACTPPGEPCATREECCPGDTTDRYACPEETGTCCVGPRNRCSSEIECCAGNGAAGCVDGSCCSYGNGPCEGDEDCCEGFFCIVNGEGGVGACQQADQAGCQTDDDCDENLFCCDQTCVDPFNDPAHCGACGATCDAGLQCVQGLCCHGEGETCEANNLGASCCLGYACVEGTCQPTDETGEPCGLILCAPNRVCCVDRCVDLATDPNNCGECGKACLDGEECIDRECRSTAGIDCTEAADCPDGNDCCSAGEGTFCTDTRNDPRHCGECSNACPEGVLCVDGVCQEDLACLPPGGDCTGDAEICCPGDVSNISGCEDGVCCVYLGDACTTGNNEECCGDLILCEDDRCCAVTGAECSGDDDCCFGHFCDGEFCQPDGGLDPCAAVTCPTNSICCGGACYDPMTDSEHCGACGNACPDGERCVEGTCEPAGECLPVNEACDETAQCCPPYSCEQDRCCASVDVECGGDDECCDGYVCDGGTCQPPDQVTDGLRTCEESADCPDGGYECCYGLCTLTDEDPYNCGSCGYRCPAEECAVAICRDGACGVEQVRDGEPCEAGGCIPDGRCQNGTCAGEAVPDSTVCYDGDPCHTSGICKEGNCEYRQVPDGTPCDQGNPCLAGSVCQGGVCRGGYAPPDTPCDAGGCIDDGTCRYGACEGQPVDEGTRCDDGNPCTDLDACDGQGVCRGTPVICEGENSYCDPSQGGCVTEEIADGSPCAEGTSFYCNQVCCEPTYFYDACAGGLCCYAESASPDGQTCCDVGDPTQGQGIGEYWVEGYGCCRIHLACGNVCCPGLVENGEIDTYCYEGQCREANLPCDQGCVNNPEVCIGGFCCPEWRACGEVCCAQNEHCENGACAPGYPRIIRTA